MKRSFHEIGTEIDNLSMAKCLILLSQKKDHQLFSFPSFDSTKISSFNTNSNRIFECKTCNRQFPSFQALGGHRASHKKPRLVNGESEAQPTSPPKPKTHECSICGLEFAIGQALGGHMRRHRASLNNNNNNDQSSCWGSGTSDKIGRTIQKGSSSGDRIEIMKDSSILKKSNSKRVLCLDLNLTPYENDLELFNKLGKTAPMVDCFF